MESFRSPVHSASTSSVFNLLSFSQDSFLTYTVLQAAANAMLAIGAPRAVALTGNTNVDFLSAKFPHLEITVIEDALAKAPHDREAAAALLNDEVSQIC